MFWLPCPKALFAAVFLGLTLPLVGRNLVLGRSILLGLAVPQISMAGIAFVFLGSAHGWNWTTWLIDDSSRAAAGALLFSVPTLLGMALARMEGNQLSEAWLAVTYLASAAAANLMLSSNAVAETYLADLFHGRLLLISDAALLWLTSVLSLVTLLGYVFQKRLLLVLLDPDFAVVTQTQTARWKLVLALLNGCAIGVSVSAVGPLVTFGFLVLPVLSASRMAHSLKTHIRYAACIGAITGITGYYVSYDLDLPLGDTTVATGAGFLLLTTGVSRWVSPFLIKQPHEAKPARA